MADIKITVKNNNEKTGNYLGYAGEFNRNDGVIRPITKVSELRKYYGEGGADQTVAEELLTQGVPLLINPVLNSTDVVSTVGYGSGTLTEAIDEVLIKNLEVPVLSGTLNDGSTVAEEIYDDFVVASEVIPVFSIYRNSSELLVYMSPNSVLANAQNGDEFKINPGTADPNLSQLTDMVFKVVNRYATSNYKRIIAIPVLSVNQDLNTSLSSMPYTTSISTSDVSYVNLEANEIYFEITGGAALTDNMVVGNVVHIEDSAVTANNNKNLTISELIVTGSDLKIKCTSSYTLTSDANVTNAGKLVYYDQNVPNTITLDGDFTSVVTPSMLLTLVRTGLPSQNVTVTNVTLTGGDTVITLDSLYYQYFTSDSLVQIPLTQGTNLILKFNTAPTYNLNVGGNFGLFDNSIAGGAVTPMTILSSFVINTVYYYVIDALTNNNNFNTVLVSEAAALHSITTRTKGNNTDLTAIISATSNGHLIAVQNISGETLESWLLYTGFDAEDVAELNAGMNLITVNLDLGVPLPAYFSTTFGGSHGAVAEADNLAAVTAFTNIPIPALYGKPKYGADVYVQNFPKTIFMEIPAEYTWQQVSAIAVGYNNPIGRNVHLSYGKFNDVALNTYAVKAFFDTKLNGDALTQTKYSMLGRLENDKINTVLSSVKVAEADELGVVTMFSVNDSFSDYHLVNNTSPYRKAPLNRANTNFILNKLIWDVVNVEFINRDKVLNMDLMREINLQFKQILSNFETYFASSKILDDSNANNLNELIYNTKQDVLNGTYKVIVELTFFNTLKKLSVEFVVS
jgi:hypothetical protein